MKKITFSLLLFCCWIATLAAQTGWTLQTNPLGTGETAMIGKVQFVSLTEGWISANGGRFLHTLDGGNNWNIVDPFPNDTVWNFSDPATDMCWTDQNHGWKINILGEDYQNSRGALLYKTINGGASWTKKYVSTSQGVVAAQLEFIDQNYGWIILYDLTQGRRDILKSGDGGETWTVINSGSTEGAWMDFVDQNNGWLVTTSPNPPYEIQKTTDGGNSWATQFVFNGYSQDSSGFDYIQFVDINHGWVAGDNGKVLKTTNGGINWDYVTNSGVNQDEDCKTLFFLDENIGWIPSKTSLGLPYTQHTTDGGNTWSTLLTPLGTYGFNAVFSIFFFNEQNGWLTADYGRICSYTGLTEIQEEPSTPPDFSLSQNYPNPFNPATVIKYSIPKEELVTLKVFNSIGEEVVRLVNETKPEGHYEVEFNAESASGGLPSGIYFFRLQAGDFLQTRKMILLK